VKRRAYPLLALGLILAAGGCGADAADASSDPSAPPPAAAPAQAVAPSGVAAPGPAVAAAAPTSSAANSQAPASKPGRKVLVDNTVNDAQLKQIIGKGYRPQSQARGNEVYYCRSERQLGSRFDSKVCRTAAEILGDEALGKQATANTERTGDNPAVK
jgi:hypothetical protein